MILVDATFSCMPTLAPSSNMNARAWVDEQLNGDGPVGLPWNSLLAFLRILTNPRIFQKPEAMTEAWKQVEEWLDCEPTWIRSLLNGTTNY